MHRSFVLAVLLITPLTGVLRAQRPLPPPLAPPPQFQRAIARETRTPTGEPGPAYWQQWTDYVLRATIDPQARREAAEHARPIIVSGSAPRCTPTRRPFGKHPFPWHVSRTDLNSSPQITRRRRPPHSKRSDDSYHRVTETQRNFSDS